MEQLTGAPQQAQAAIEGPANTGTDIGGIIDMVGKAMARQKRGDDAVTRAIKANTQASQAPGGFGPTMAQGMIDLVMAGSEGLRGGSVSNAYSKIKANRLAAAEKAARLQLEADRVENQREAGIRQIVLGAFQQAEQNRRAALERDLRSRQFGITQSRLESQNAETRRHNRAIEGKKTAFDQKVDALEASGIPRNYSKGIAAGRYVVSRHPISGVGTVIDKFTGKPVWEMGRPPPKDVPEVPSTMPKGVDFSQGTGSSGFFGNIANTITDALGAGLAAPQTDKAVAALEELRARTEVGLQAEVPGRPSTYLMQRLSKLTVTPKSLFEGDARSKNRMEQARRLVAEKVQQVEEVLANPGDYKPTEISKTRRLLPQLQAILKAYDDVLGSFGEQNEQDIPAPETFEEYKKIKPGMRYRHPDGSIRVKK